MVAELHMSNVVSISDAREKRREREWAETEAELLRIADGPIDPASANALRSMLSAYRLLGEVLRK